jgi:hypothetical protein
MVYYWLFFELQIKSYEFLKIWHNSDSKSNLNSVLNRKPTCGYFLLVHTGSAGLTLWCVGSKVIWAARIVSYPFVKWIYQIHWILIWWPGLKGRERGYLGFTVDASDMVCALVEIGSDILVTPSRRRCYDGLREVKTSSPVWSVSRIASRWRRRARLEWRRRRELRVLDDDIVLRQFEPNQVVRELG